MLVKTKAVLLHHIRHSDNSLVACFYTREYGRVTVMVRGTGSKKKSTRSLYFQPMYIFEIEMYYRDTREMHNLKEMALLYTPSEIPVDIHKSTIVMFLSEVLYSVVREEDANKPLYNFIESSVRTLDSMHDGVSNFHLWFLVSLTRLVGIGPTPSALNNSYFDMINGQFCATPPLHSDYLNSEHSLLLNSLLKSDIEGLPSIHLSGNERSALLEKIMNYYNLHLPGLRHIRSLQVLNDIFR